MAEESSCFSCGRRIAALLGWMCALMSRMCPVDPCPMEGVEDTKFDAMASPAPPGAVAPGLGAPRKSRAKRPRVPADGKPVNHLEALPELRIKPCRVGRRHMAAKKDGLLDIIEWTDDAGEKQCFWKVRGLQNSLMGKVYHYARVGNDAESVAVKTYDKMCVEQGITLAGKPTAEDPLWENRVLQHLSQSDVVASGRSPDEERGERDEKAAATGHPNVIRLVEFLDDGRTYYAVLEYLSGDTFKLVQDAGRLEEGAARSMFWQIVSGLKFCHDRGIVHLDMSLENVMLDDGNNARLIDFGMSLPRTALSANNCRGKSLYIPPEQYLSMCPRGCPRSRCDWSGRSRFMGQCSCTVESLRPFDPAVGEIWSLGSILFIMLTGVPAVANATMADERFAIISRNPKGVVALLDAWGLSARLSAEAVDLLGQLMRADPASRPQSLDDVLRHPWFRDVASC